MSKALIAVDRSRSFRLFLTITTDLVETARRIHGTTPLATAGLGRVLTGAGLMGLMLKDPTNKLTVLFKGDGPAQQILAVADGAGHVKGYIGNPDVDLPLRADGKLDVGGSLGTGQLTVIKDLGLKEPYTGTIALVSGEIAEDLTAYHYISEQENTAMALGVKVDTDLSVAAAGGLLVQMLPEAEDGAVDALEALLADMPPITTLISRVYAQAPVVSGETGLLQDLLSAAFGPLPDAYQPVTLEVRDLNWQCDCSRERLEQALVSIGPRELSSIIEEDGRAELVCRFCGKKYDFDRADLTALLAQL